MRALLLIVLSTMAVSAPAAPLPETPGLLPTLIVRPLLEQDPSVTAARASLEAARQEAGILESSPYEWNARLSSQRRTLQSGPHYQEWNVGIERTLRLPGKAAADRNIGKATVEEAEARYGDAKHEAARELLTLWLDWLHAERAYELAGANGQAAQENLNAVEKRMRAGDAARLDVSLAQAELAEQKRIANDAKTQVAVANARLQARFPSLGRQFTVSPTLLPLKEKAAFWRERIFAQSDELKTVQAQLQRALAQAERARRQGAGPHGRRLQRIGNRRPGADYRNDDQHADPGWAAQAARCQSAVCRRSRAAGSRAQETPTGCRDCQ